MNYKKNDVNTINLRQIEKSRELALGAAQKDIAKYEKVVSAFGNVAPAIVAKEGGSYSLIDGHARLEAYKRAGVYELPAIITQTEGEVERLKLSLLLSACREQGNALGEGALIEILVIEHGHTLGQISALVGRSKAWLSKRRTMARNLSAPLCDMVVNGIVCTRAAEEISKLPKDKQAVFAANVARDKFNKEDIGRLVKLYRSPDATHAFRRMIIESPAEALTACPKTGRVRRLYKYNPEGRLQRSAYYAMHFLSALKDMICGSNAVELSNAMEHILKLRRQMQSFDRMIAALNNPAGAISPGKTGGGLTD